MMRFHRSRTAGAVLFVLVLVQQGSSRQEQPVAPAASFSLTPKHSKQYYQVAHDGASFDIDKDALAADWTLTVKPMARTDLVRLDEGMTLVTRRPRCGYRLLPHGTKFKKPIQITLPYDRDLLPPGTREENVRTFYYDEAGRAWKQVPCIAVDTKAGTVTSATDHFTDFVNATLTVPEHPGLATLNPNDFKKMKPADPSAQIKLMAPPKANNQGDAQLSFPLELPPGRCGMDPTLGIQYSSSGANGWLGLGWALPVTMVGVDPRWGVPRYDPACETESYIVDGVQLTPLAHRGTPVARQAEKTFRRRIEGSFARIVRHGDSPSTYWWEITDKDGVRSFYGGDRATGLVAPDSVLATPSGAVFQWALREIVDTNGNFVRYRYEKVVDVGLDGGVEPGVNLYLKSVTYTGQGTQDGAYQVSFSRDRDLGEARRPDVQIDCRGGLKRVTADLLRRIDVTFNNQLIRRYRLDYQEGAFRKSLLSSIVQFGEDGTTEFHRHTFQYFDDVRTPAGDYHGFDTPAGWDTGNDNVTAGLLGNGRASALGGNTGSRIGGHLYVGFNPGEPTKEGSAGFKIGFNRSDAEGVVTMADVNGDHLPDKIVKTDHGMFYRLNQSGPGGTTVFGPALPLGSLPAISTENSTTFSFGGEVYVIANIFANVANTFTKGRAYLSDVNGDGFPDLVKDGAVHFGYLDAQGKPAFTLNSLQTPVPVGPGAVDATEIIEDFEALYQQNLDTYPLQDTLRRWVAPFDGTIQITAPVALIQDLSPARQQYTTADGVRVAIQQNGAELWAETIGPDDYAPRNPAGVGAVPVQRGDRITFRVQSVFDGSYDQVSWDPEITYVNVAAAPDVNGLNVYRAKASEDFTFAGRPGIFVRVPINGVVRLTGDLQKTGPTTDDVTLVVTRNGAPVFTQTLAAADTGSIALNQEFNVARQDTLQLRVKVDSPIDLSRLQWLPSLFYVSSPDVATVTDANGNFILQLNPPYDIDFYPVNDLTAPQETWTVTQTGTLTIVPQLTVANNTDATLIFTVKKPGQLLAKKTIQIQNGIVVNPTFTLDVTEGDKLAFDFSAYNSALRPMILTTAVSAYYATPQNSFLVPSAFHSVPPAGLFPSGYRGWSTVGYNGNRERAALPVDESLLVINDQYNFQNARVYPFNPFPSTGKWRGPDDHAWVSPGQVSSTRLGLKFIQVPRPNDFAGARGVTRLSRSQQTAVGGGISLVSGSLSEGKSQGLVDFLDLNGDQFPDIVGNGRIQYTTPTGGLEGTSRSVPGFGKVRESRNDQRNFGIGASPAMFTGDSLGRNGSAGTDTGSQLPPLGLSGGLGSGTSETREDLVDLNGDGLPDRVSMSGNTVMVALNLGYAFGQPEPWGTSGINDGSSDNLSIGGSLGYNDGIYGWGGGISLSKNTGNASVFFADLNGDGLPDRVRTAGNTLLVRFNTGQGFGAEVAWGDGVAQGLAKTGNISLGGGLYFTIGVGPLCIGGCYLIINPGFDGDVSMSRPETAVRDIDGDGYADFLKSDRDDAMTVVRNLTGKTNLLKAIHRPLGGTFTLDYGRSGNTPDQPQSRWVLSRLAVFDGHPGDGADTMLTTYRYEGGRYSRLEREFFGYAKVTAEERDAAGGEALYRVLVSEFSTDSFYLRGLLRRETRYDAANRPFTQNETTYVLRDADTGVEPADPSSLTASEFPMALRVDRRSFEGNPAPAKTTFLTQTYDALGNMTGMFDAGDVGAQDDLEARVVYSSFAARHIVGKPVSMQVFGNGVLMRHREATLDPATGNLLQLRQHLENGQIAVTDLTYFPDGNLRTVTQPPNEQGQRYTLTYEVDASVATHVTKITDSFGYVSQTSYHLKYGRPHVQTDINNNQTETAVDIFGRTTAVTAPYELGGPQATVTVEYHPDAPVPWARTRLFDRFRDPNDPIDTVLFTDGLGRILQTKSDATLFAGAGAPSTNVMVVSGHVTYDLVGRADATRFPTTEPLGQAGTFNPAVDPEPPTRVVYDVLDRTVKTTIPDGSFCTVSYGFGADRAGLTQFASTVTDANGNRKVTYRNHRGLISSLQEFNPSRGQTLWTSYGYDAMKQPTQVTDDQGNVTRVAYDNLGRRVSIDNPDTGKTVDTFDLSGNRTRRSTSELAATGAFISFAYDFNRLARVTYPRFAGNNVTYEYGAPGAPFNRAGRIQKITDQGGTETRSYGKIGEVVEETRMIRMNVGVQTWTTRYSFDSFGRLQQLTYPDGEVLTYRYDSGGLVRAGEGIKEGRVHSYFTRLEYDKFGSKAFLALGNGTSTTWEFNSLTRRLAALKSAAAGGSLFQDYRYSFDNVGNLLSLQNQAPIPPSLLGGPKTESFVYDDLYRLSHAEGTFSGSFQSTYSVDMAFDTIHNLEQKSQSVRNDGKVDKTRSYVLNYRYESTHPHAPTTVGKRDFTYDANGNQKSFEGNDDFGSSGKVRRTITWDEENRAQTIDDGGTGSTVSFAYDHAGRRLLKRQSGDDTAYFNQFLTIQSHGSGVLWSKHVFVGNMRIVSNAFSSTNDGNDVSHQEGFLFFYHGDHLGSTNFVSARDGSLREHLEVLPSGEGWVAQRIDESDKISNVAYQFTGKELDLETNLYYFGARYYDPRTSVWQSADPILPQLLGSSRQSAGEGIFSSMRLNLYAYAGQNPVMMTDPDGRFFILDDFAVGLFRGIFKGFAELFSGGAWYEPLWQPIKTGWDTMVTSAQIWSTLFRGSLCQIITRVSWELPQTIAGLFIAEFFNILGGVEKVGFNSPNGDALGVAFIESGWMKHVSGVTIGAFMLHSVGDLKSHIPDGKGGSIMLWKHEFGHYLDSQVAGPFWVPFIGLPSLCNQMFDHQGHTGFVTELNANDAYRKHEAKPQWGGWWGRTLFGASPWYERR